MKNTSIECTHYWLIETPDPYLKPKVMNAICDKCGNKRTFPYLITDTDISAYYEAKWNDHLPRVNGRKRTKELRGM